MAVTGPHDALGALFLSGASAVGRRFHPAENGRPPKVLRNGPVQTATKYRLVVAGKDVRKLERELDERYRRGARKEEFYNDWNQVTYVRDDEPYGAFNNCNHMTARSLQKLGCRIDGLVGWASYTVGDNGVRPAEPSAPPPTALAKANGPTTI